jgi:hypothetical protein
MCSRALWTVFPWGSSTAFFGVTTIFAFIPQPGCCRESVRARAKSPAFFARRVTVSEQEPQAEQALEFPFVTGPPDSRLFADFGNFHPLRFRRLISERSHVCLNHCRSHRSQGQRRPRPPCCRPRRALNQSAFCLHLLPRNRPGGALPQINKKSFSYKPLAEDSRRLKAMEYRFRPQVNPQPSVCSCAIQLFGTRANYSLRVSFIHANRTPRFFERGIGEARHND